MISTWPGSLRQLAATGLPRGIRWPVLGLVALANLGACSNQQVYEAVQRNQRLECQKIPLPQQDECMEQNSESYEEYRRNREALDALPER